MSIVVGENKFGPYFEITSITFSPDGKRFGAAVKKSVNNYQAIIDGNEGSLYGFMDVIVFSPDGNHVAYRARRLGEDIYHILVYDREEINDYYNIGPLVFSGDSTKLAFSSRTKRDMSMSQLYVNNKIVGRSYYGTIGSYMFSPDSKHIAYIFSDSGKWSVSIDGEKTDKKYEDVSSLVWMPNSSGIAYRATIKSNGLESFVVLRNQKLGPYEYVSYGVSGDKVFLNYNGSTAAYRAKVNGKIFAIIGEYEFQYDEVLNNFVFSPDGKKVAYFAIENGKYLTAMFENGQIQRGNYYDEVIGNPVFDKSGNHLAYIARNGSKALLVIDGAESKLYDWIGYLNFKDNIGDKGGFEYWARLDRFLWRVSEKITY